MIKSQKFFSSEGFRKMDINKVDLVLKYILAAAGRKGREGDE
jgi:hypothetical protein